jgi:hypothetical protein
MEEKMEKKKPRRVPTEYQCIYRQTDKDLYDVRYNYKELNEDTGKTEYKTKWVYGVKRLSSKMMMRYWIYCRTVISKPSVA